ncbi:MAG: redox-sensing transcriptional repressor Rex [Acidimicrobiales bacterium]
MESPSRVPEATVSRLAIYVGVLRDMLASGLSAVSSEQLAELAGVTGVQVRKDLSRLGSYGVRGVGYDVAFLEAQISRELGVVGEVPIVIVGVGNLGRALARYQGLPERGFHVAAAFDVDPRIVGASFGGVTVMADSGLEEYLSANDVGVAVITTPAWVAQGVADRLVACGIGALLNFAPVVLSVPEHVSLRCVDIGVELQVLSFYRSRGAPASPPRAPTGETPRIEACST